MATSSSDESTAPKDFHLSSSQDSGSKYSSSRQRCPLCSSYRKKFYCRDCIHGGEFGNLESYAAKQARLSKLREESSVVEEKCFRIIEKNQKADFLLCGIRQSQNNIELLKLALEEKLQRRKCNDTKLDELKTKNTKLNDSLPKYSERVDKLGNYVAEKRKKIEKSKLELSEKQEEIKKITRIRIKELMLYIFPITKIQPRSMEMESSENDMVTALAEASHTTYIKDRWVFTDNSGELQHSIVAPTLPGSGNYSDYNLWLAQNKDTVPGGSTSTSIERNPVYGISAALTYTAQLLNIISFYLDVRLPYKMVYSDFCSSSMNEQQFSRRVARLNANVLHLCFSQNTDLTLLQPTQTLHNILQLVDQNNAYLGRQGPMEVDVTLSSNLEDQLANDLQTSEDSDSEEGDALPNEWEAVPHVQCPEANAGPMNLQSTTQTLTSQQANSVSGGLVTSAAASIMSMWRGWTGR